MTDYLSILSMLHVLALSFDHRNGNQIDSIFPPFPEDPSLTPWLHALPFIAIPDKAHSACSSLIQFTLPYSTASNHCVYGLAAFRAIEASELSPNTQYIRNFVQKSLAVISQVPLFGELETRLKESLYQHFDSLPTKLESLFESFLELCNQQTVPFSGISYSSLFQSLQQNVLVLIKAILRHHSILIFAPNSELVSKMVCAVVSLLPGFIYSTPYPFRFLDSGGYSFSPYVPLQFADTLNSGKRGYKLMGTCSELFLDQKVVEYDILVDCRTLPATVHGEALNELRLTQSENIFLQELLEYLKENWTRPEAAEKIREDFLKYINSVFTLLLRIRNIKLIPPFTWKYLDWESTVIFGEKFMKHLAKDSAIQELIKRYEENEFEPVDGRFFVKKTK
jgi:hypothetical protein